MLYASLLENADVQTALVDYPDEDIIYWIEQSMI